MRGDGQDQTTCQKCDAKNCQILESEDSEEEEEAESGYITITDRQARKEVSDE